MMREFSIGKRLVEHNYIGSWNTDLGKIFAGRGYHCYWFETINGNNCKRNSRNNADYFINFS